MTRPFVGILSLWPNEPGDPVSALLHTLDAYADEPDDDMVIIATTNVYGPHVRTGLTHGDLRHIANLLKEKQ